MEILESWKTNKYFESVFIDKIKNLQFQKCLQLSQINTETFVEFEDLFNYSLNENEMTQSNKTLDEFLEEKESKGNTMISVEKELLESNISKCRNKLGELKNKKIKLLATIIDYEYIQLIKSIKELSTIDEKIISLQSN